MEELIADGKFRADLYYRLNTLKLTMPDLETRKEDIPPLCRYFLKRYSAKYSVPIPALSPEDSEILLKRSWPGNVRELENTMHRYVILSSLQHCSVNDCLDGTPPKQAASSGASQPPLEGTLAQMELALIRKCLEENHGSREKRLSSWVFHAQLSGRSCHSRLDGLPDTAVIINHASQYQHPALLLCHFPYGQPDLLSCFQYNSL